MSESENGVRLTDQERLDWLRLIRSENIGPRTFRTLVDQFGSAQAALASLPGLARRGGAGGPARICAQADAERELKSAWSLGIELVALGEPGYPWRLAMIDDPPPLVAVRGDLAILQRPMIAVVGARNASAAGIKLAGHLARALGEAGLVVVSGLARGIDAAAHRASLETGTIAALAGGHNHIYPPEHVELAGMILAHGVTLTEMPLDREPRSHDFPRRNRLISGLAVGVVVVEAARRSGSLITTRMALEQGREVFAVPGSPLDPRAEGSNSLLKQGAILVTEAEDVLAVLRPILDQPLERRLAEEATPAAPAPPAAEPGPDERNRIVALLGPVPVSIDDLVRLAGRPPAVVRTVLLELEVAGRLQRHGGGLVSLM
ncbi:MAG TPA: DNA-processing protein DprA [Xanthobacteraceae bacterium]